MSDSYSYDGYSSSDLRGETPTNPGRFSSIPPMVKSALIFAIPFTILDFFNYYTAGSALILSCWILAILYGACGFLAAKFAKGSDGMNQSIHNGLLAALLLWLFSTSVNTIIAIVIGAASVGATLILGFPYLCCVAPTQLIFSGLLGTLGGFIFDQISGNRTRRSSDSSPVSY
jgi:hypothetical protein